MKFLWITNSFVGSFLRSVSYQRWSSFFSCLFRISVTTALIIYAAPSCSDDAFSNQTSHRTAEKTQGGAPPSSAVESNIDSARPSTSLITIRTHEPDTIDIMSSNSDHNDLAYTDHSLDDGDSFIDPFTEDLAIPTLPNSVLSPEPNATTTTNPRSDHLKDTSAPSLPDDILIVANPDIDGRNVDITVENVRGKDGGKMCIAIYDNSEHFLTDESLVASCGPPKDLVIFSVELPWETRDIAVSVLHDSDRNGELSLGLFGIPREGVGFSNNPSLIKGAPSFHKAKISLASDPKPTINIRMIYFW